MPPKKDGAKHALRRQLALQPSMDAFVRSVRVAEGFLSAAQVGKRHDKNLNSHNALMHKLGKSMLCMGLVGARQSRAAAWSTFSQMVAAEAQRRWERSSTGQSDMQAVPIEDFRPSHWKGDSQLRQYQFIAVRLHACGHIVPALVERVWSSYHKGTKSRSVESDCPLKSTSCTKVHVVPLEKAGECMHWVHSQMRSIRLTPHHPDGCILWELPQKVVQVQECDVYLKVMIGKSCLAAMAKMDGSGWTVSTAQNQANQPGQTPGQSQSATIYTADSFQQNKVGRANICGYMAVMRTQYERLLGRSLCDESGQVNCLRVPGKKSASPPTWPTLVARAPGYFDILWKSRGPGKLGNPGSQFSGFSGYVWSTFSSVAPVVEADKFIAFLKEVHANSLPALPV